MFFVYITGQAQRIDVQQVIQQRGNGTSVFLLWSLSSKSSDFPVGTKLYLADTKQVDRVMSGQRIDDGAPFLVVTDALDGKSVNLR